MELSEKPILEPLDKDARQILIMLDELLLDFQTSRSKSANEPTLNLAHNSAGAIIAPLQRRMVRTALTEGKRGVQRIIPVVQNEIVFQGETIPIHLLFFNNPHTLILMQRELHSIIEALSVWRPSIDDVTLTPGIQVHYLESGLDGSPIRSSSIENLNQNPYENKRVISSLLQNSFTVPSVDLTTFLASGSKDAFNQRKETILQNIRDQKGIKLVFGESEIDLPWTLGKSNLTTTLGHISQQSGILTRQLNIS